MSRFSLSQNISTSFAELSAASQSLNNVSDALGKAVTDIDEGLRKLNLGITAWVDVFTTLPDHPENPTYMFEELGYTKINTKWGVALRVRSGDESQPYEQEHVQMWAFNDAPRALRLEAIDKLPRLLRKLSEEAQKVTAELQAKLADAQTVASTIQPRVRR